ncbi:MAG: outer membrane protein [Verrucomicrobiota bacterium]|jgi:outer membrane protein
MKTILPKLILLVALALFVELPARAEQKIGIIDLKKVFDEFFKTKIADAQIKDEAASLDKDRKALTDQAQKTIEEYKKAVEDANNQAISADEREKRKKAAEGKLIEVNELEQQIKQFDRTARGNLEEKQTRAREKILKEIQTIVNTKAKASGYALILDSAAEGASRTFVVFYNNGQDDLTAAVIKDLNANAPTDLPKTDRKDDKK